MPTELEIELSARVMRLEELVVALWNRQHCDPLAMQIDDELHAQGRTAGAYPEPMQNRVNGVRNALQGGDECTNP